MNRGGRLLFGVALIVPLILATGCLPYAYPKLAYVPGAELGPEVSDVHAFRVDAVVSQPLIGFITCEYSLSEITPKADGRIPSKMSVTLEGGASLLWSPFEPGLGWTHDTRVRLYRPGYRLIELRSWDSSKKIAWQAAPDWGSQEQALLGLLASPHPPHYAQGPPIVAGFVWDPLLLLPPATPEAEQAINLAITECERLAKCAPTPEDAARVSELAEKLIERRSAASKSKK